MATATEKLAIINAMKRTYQMIGDDVFGEYHPGSMAIREVVVDANHLEQNGGNKEAALRFRAMPKTEQADMLRIAFP